MFHYIDRLTKEQLSYLAGFIDGEGSISIVANSSRKTRHWSGCLSLTNTNKEIITIISDWLFVKFYKGIPKNSTHSISYEIKIRRAPLLLKILKAVYPYLVVKKAHAKLVIKYLEKKGSKELTKLEESIYIRKIRELCQKGRAPIVQT